jgi:hypothetical protein
MWLLQSNVQVQWSPRVQMRDISVRHKTCDSIDELSAKPHECCANAGAEIQVDHAKKNFA